MRVLRNEKNVLPLHRAKIIFSTDTKDTKLHRESINERSYGTNNNAQSSINPRGAR